MTSKTTNKFSPEVRERAVRLVFDHEADCARLDIIDLIVKLKKFSSLRIKLVVESSGIRIVVKPHKGASDRIHEEAFVAS